MEPRDEVSARRSLVALASLCISLPATNGSAVYAQSSVQSAAADSLIWLRKARRAQRDFERIRRAHLPSEPGAGNNGCDERIGRFCYWYEPFTDPSLAEPNLVRRARQTLLDDLGAAHRRLAGDGWITGQLVRYLLEQGMTDSAVVTAQSCRSTRWWCDALGGFARHLSHDYAGADTAFGRALQAMPDEMRCAWTDLGPLLGDGDRLSQAVPCVSGDSVRERIWWLARPLYSRPGNDLRTEHYARHTMAALLHDAATPDGVSWGADRRNLVVRFGWPTHWSQSWESSGGLSPPPILGHEPGPSFWLFPDPTVAEPWSDVTEIRWDPGRERPPARYAPPYATGFASIDRVQFARFLRGDSTLSVAVFDLTPDSVFAAHPADVRLAVARDPATPVVVGAVSAATPRGALTVRSPWRPAVLSLEAVGMDTPWVARRRVLTAADPGGLPPIVSDLLLFATRGGLPGSLEATLGTALSAPVVRRRQRVGLYWEVYQESDSTASVEIAVTPMKPKKRGDTPYPVSRPWCPFAVQSPVRMRWLEEPTARPRGAARAVALDLRRLSPGRYLITLQVSEGGQARGCSSREVQVAR
jgi:hypothetical protein